MINNIVMDRVETLEYIKNNINSKERIILPRYNDGEYILMNKLKGHVAQDSPDLISKMLIDSIKVKGQLVCINYLKPHNIEKKDIWFQTQRYLHSVANQDKYGCGNWSVYDFSNNNEVLPLLFSGRVLLVAGLADEARHYFTSIQSSGIDIYKTPTKNAVDNYEDIKKDLQTLCKYYTTILFSCGPVGKALIADFVNLCDCNLIDIGAVLNAIIGVTGKWPMSWVNEVDLDKQRKDFCDKLRGFNV
jgi:hypothetical protein